MLQRTNYPACSPAPGSDLLPAHISTATSAKGSSLLQEFVWVAFMVKIKQKENPSNAGWRWLPAAVTSAVLGRRASCPEQLAVWGAGAGPQMGRNTGSRGRGSFSHRETHFAAQVHLVHFPLLLAMPKEQSKRRSPWP